MFRFFVIYAITRTFVLNQLLTFQIGKSGIASVDCYIIYNYFAIKPSPSARTSLVPKWVLCITTNKKTT